METYREINKPFSFPCREEWTTPRMDSTTGEIHIFTDGLKVHPHTGTEAGFFYSNPYTKKGYPQRQHEVLLCKVI